MTWMNETLHRQTGLGVMNSGGLQGAGHRKWQGFIYLCIEVRGREVVVAAVAGWDGTV